MSFIVTKDLFLCFSPPSGIFDPPCCSERVLFGLTMTGYSDTSNALTLLILLMGASFLHLSGPYPINTAVDVESPHRNAPRGQTASGDGKRGAEERQPIQKDEAEEDELFEDVDPKTLAAVLLEALNHSQVERRREEEEHDRMEEYRKTERREVKKEKKYTDMRTMEGADRDRDGQQELKLLMATQGRDQEKEEEEERKKKKEEELMTEKVTSRTTSQTVQVQTEQQLISPGDNGKGAVPQEGPTTPEQASNEEEEQLSPVELKSLETMMKEFPRLNTATEREGGFKQNQRESRDYSNYNDIIPLKEGSNLAMSKKKLKWQEETQKALNLPTFRGGNFMDDMVDRNYDRYAAQSQPPAEQTEREDTEIEQNEEEDEEVLSPEEEEAQAKAEQEEMRRQAAEAQRAKMEEEKLADIASDMLLRYMVKQNNGNKKNSSPLSSAAEDKRSNEEQEVIEEDDIDPQTIDKLIEISSKLHLPADDVVDIISDVEKKKKKDVPPEMTSHWHKATSLSSLFPSTNGFSPSEISDNENNYPVSKQSSPVVNRLKTWFREKAPTKSQDHWGKPAKSLLVNPNIRVKPQQPLSIKQDLWFKSPKSVWTGYHSYPYTYPSYYQPYPDSYPIYFPPPPRPISHYYIHKPALNLNTFLRNTVDDIYTFPLKRRYHSWVQPWLRKPPVGLQQMPYYTGYPLPLYRWTFQPVSIPKSHSLPQMAVIPSHQKQFYYPPSAPAVTRNKDYYVSGKQTDGSTHEDLEKYIEKIFMKTPKMFD